jgi:beta-lactamase superfamily II metal-dependent hydrolase
MSVVRVPSGMPRTPSWICLASLVLSTGCGGALEQGGIGGDQVIESAAQWAVHRAVNTAQVPASAPKAGQFRVHAIDVGTGLSILVQGSDFTMLYDGGSNDDFASGANNRLLAYLAAALGPSGPADCTPNGDGWARADRTLIKIDHVFLSHPHQDHDSLLPDVLHCYDVREVWDSGDDNNRDGYRDFLAAAVARPGVKYHDAGGHIAGEVITVGGRAITLPPTTTAFTEGDVLHLGTKATATILHVDGRVTSDENLNSIVMRVQLGTTRLLLAGDEEAGDRSPPTSSEGAVEADLVARHTAELAVDILQVPHHGSSTSSRLQFLQAVHPAVAIVSAGPKPYAGVVLPDQNVIDAINALPNHPMLLRTDTTDATITQCAPDRIGRENASSGGCDNWIIDISR